MDEFSKQMSNHKITCKNSMSDDVVLIVEGGLMNPIEQDLLEALYFKKEIPIIRVAEVEKELGSYIDDNKLLMSLKLSKDSERLRSFLKNSLITFQSGHIFIYNLSLLANLLSDIRCYLKSFL